jgi:hypothetical protein
MGLDDQLPVIGPVSRGIAKKGDRALVEEEKESLE